MKIFWKLLRYAGVLLLFAITVFFVGVYWPFSTPQAPDRADKTLVAGVTIVDVRSGRLLPGRDILVEHGKISTIGINLPRQGAKIIEAEDHYAIPGLFDMHMHSVKMAPVLSHPMFVAAGVTAVRDMGGCIGLKDAMVACLEDKQAWHAASITGSGVHPHYDQITSLAINGGPELPSELDANWHVTDADTAQKRAKFDSERGVDFLKTYSLLNRQAYFALAEAAKKEGFYLAGHVPIQISSQEAAEAGQRSIEHAFSFIWDCYPAIDEFRSTGDLRAFFTNEARAKMIDGHDKQMCSDLHQKMIENNVAYVPTHTTRKLDAFALDEDFRSDVRLKYIPSPLRQMWLGDADSMAAKAGEGGAESYRRFYEFGLLQTGIAHKAGVTVLAGSDAPDSFVFPGFSLHDELAHLTQAGLTPIDALRAATLEPARFLGLARKAGEITEGARADIVLLTEDPVEDINAVRNIAGVMLSGAYYNGDARAALLEGVEKAANSWSIWPKFIWQFLHSPIMMQQFAD